MDKSIIHKLVLFIAAICTTFSVSAYDFEVDGIYYNKISDTSVEVTHDGSYNNTGVGYNGVVIIPGIIEINGITYSVRGIGIRAFSNCPALTSVTIPDGVTSIGGNAFLGCTGLTSIFIPDGVTSISIGAFMSCTSLTEIIINENNPNYTSIDGVLFNKTYTELMACPAGKAGIYNIPEGVISVCDGAFYSCTGLTSVTIPGGVTSIGNLAFWGCNGLTSVSIPASVTFIGTAAFCGCSGLTSITIPEGVTSISEGTFWACTGLTSVTIPGEATSIGTSAFRDCTGLTSVSISEGVTSIDTSAFRGCSGLTSVTIPTSVTSIGGDAFYGCTGLTSVTIPEGVTSIGGGAFYGCTGLTEIIINENNPNYASIDGVLFNKTYSELILCPAGKAGIYNIPTSVTSIDSFAFYSCTGLTSVSIPDGVTSIESGVFSGCTSLTSVNISASVTSIRPFAFDGCTALNKVICFAETVPTFSHHVFDGVPTACSIYVPSGSRDSYASADELASYTIKEFGLTVTPAELTLEVGATAELTASYTIDGAAETEMEISSVLGTEFIWSSSTENVAAVSTSGQVTAHNAGTAEIKVITSFGNTVFATSTVNVGTSGILDVSADSIEISATPGKIMVENIGENQKVSAYTIDGICQIFQVSKDGTVEIPAETGKIYIIVVDGFATKVLAK